MSSDEALIHRCIDGVATREELAALNARLHDDFQLRALYLDCMNLDAALAAAAEAHEDIARAHAAGSTRRRWWNSTAQLAAGIVLGAASVSAVWAYAVPKDWISRAEPIPLADAGFEFDGALKVGAVPIQSGEWRGDPAEQAEAWGSVRPRSGTKMLRFIRPDVADDSDESPYVCCDVWQTLELPGKAGRVCVRAWFNAETPAPARFHVAAVAGRSDVRSPLELWRRRASTSPEVLAFCRSVFIADRNPATWQLAEASIDVPSEARVLVIGLGGYRLNAPHAADRFPGQFADDVSVTFQEAAAQP